MPYTRPTLTGYNADPPSDDGAQTAMNRVDWAKHLEKIGNPLRVYADAINNGVSTALDGAPEYHPTIAAMTAITSPEDGRIVTVTEAGRSGLFVFDTNLTGAADNHTTFAADDATSGLWVWRDVHGISRGKPSVLFPNAIWTWWQPDLAVHRNGVTYLCYSDDAGRSYVSSYDEETGVVNQSFIKQYTPDDHHAGALVVTDDEPVVVFTHGRTLTLINRIYYRRSASPGNVSSFGEEESFNFVNPAGQTDYPTASVSGSEILVMCRMALTRWAARYAAWPLAETPDWGSNDGADCIWFTGEPLVGRPYILPRQDRSDPDIVHLALGTLPEVTANQEDVRYGYIRISTGGIFTGAGVEIGNLKTGVNLPLTFADFTSVYVAPAGTKTRVYDISSDGQAILFSTYTGNGLGATASNYQYARKQVDNTWTVHQVAATGTALIYNYFGSGAFDYENSRLFYLCRESAGTWSLESVVSNNEASFTASLVESSTDILMRPITVKTPGNKIRYLWQRLNYYTAFEEFYSDARMHATDENRTPNITAGSILKLGTNPLDLSNNETLGSPQDLRPTSFSLFGDTYVTHVDIPLDDGWREMEVLLQGPDMASTGAGVELRAQLLDALGDPITGNVYTYAGTQTTSRVPANNVIGAEGADHFLLARGIHAGGDYRPRGRIRLYTYGGTSTMHVMIQVEMTSAYSDTGFVVVKNSYHGFADVEFASGIRLYASTGNIRNCVALNIGTSSYDSSIL